MAMQEVAGQRPSYAEVIAPKVDALIAAVQQQSADNHHNAATCPYCNPQLEKQQAELRQSAAEVARLKLKVDLFKEEADQAIGVAKQLQQERDTLRQALEKIARWFGEFPPTTDREGRPSTFAAEYGSNGERDYMRQIALDALNPSAALSPAPPPETV